MTMERPIFVELFSGSGTIAAAARRVGFRSVTIDIDPRTKPDICLDITNLRRSILPKNVAVVWASPPCTKFSLLQSSRHFESRRVGYRKYYHEPKTNEAIQALWVLSCTLRLICQLNPEIYYIENPRGILRHRPELVMVPYRKTVRYSDFGAEIEKPTDIFTNNPKFNPTQSKRPKNLKHLTEIGTVEERATIPTELAKYIAEISATSMPGLWILSPELEIK